jgi:hypothetical protein
MTDRDPAEALDAFLLLADQQRLRAAAALVLGARTTDDVVAASGLSSRDVLEALTRLEAGELVRREGNGWVFDVRRMSELAREARPKPEPDDLGDVPADTALVLRRFLRDGRLLSIPVQRSRRLIVLDHVAAAFELGVRYPERNVNALLGGFHEDFATLRRYLVDEGFLTREAGVYWRSGGSVALSEEPSGGVAGDEEPA